MAEKSYKKNIFYNSIYRCIVFISPLITSPYLARVLGAEKLGIYSDTNAFATYFVIFALLGVNDYGNRSVAQVRDDREKLSDTFWQIYYLQFFLTIILSAVYFFSIINARYFLVRMVLGIYVLSSLFEISWYAIGLEKFKLTSTINTITHIGIVVSIFTFVKQPDDVWKYALIIVLGNLISLLFLLPLVRKYTDFRKPDFKKIAAHLKPNLLLFLPVIATSVYQYLNKIMLSAWSTEAEVGFYQNAENIVKLPTFITTAIVTVMLPYASNLIAKGETEDNQHLLASTLKYTSIINVAMSFGIFAVAKDFIPWYLGSAFERSATLVMIMTPTIFLNGFSGVLRYQYIIPNEMDRANLVSMFSGALADIVFNFILIPPYGASGAAVATVLAYVVTLLVQVLYVRKEIDLKNVILSFAPSVVFGVLMVLCVFFVSRISLPTILRVLIEVLAGASVFIVCTAFWLEKTGDHIFSNMMKSVRRKLGAGGK